MSASERDTGCSYEQVVAVELNQDVQPFSQLTLCTFLLVNYVHDSTSAFEKTCKMHLFKVGIYKIQEIRYAYNNVL